MCVRPGGLYPWQEGIVCSVGPHSISLSVCVSLFLSKSVIIFEQCFVCCKVLFLVILLKM